MITVRPSAERGVATFDWLHSRHTFSFGYYYDPEHMGFGNLRVINEDRVVPGAGFDTHGHRDMEIISYVLEGSLEHRDSIGNGSVIRPGDVQRMSAGTGIRHSEFNHSQEEPVHFLQIWITPERHGLDPSYEQKHFALETKRSALRLVGSRDARDDSVTIHQDVDLYAVLLGEGNETTHEIGSGRKVWTQVVRGSVELNQLPLEQGDGAAVEHETRIVIRSTSGAADAEVLVFDMA